MNLLEYRTELRRRVGNPTVAEVPDTELDDRINDAITDIVENNRFHSGRKVVTFPTVSGTPRYTLPADCPVVMKVTLIGVNESYSIDKTDEVYAQSVDEDSTGKPIKYLRQRDWIQLMPTPDDAYTIKLFYKAVSTPLVVDADTPIVPTTWDQGVLYLARAKHWDVRGDFQKASFAYNAWQMWYKNKPVEVDEELFADDYQGVIIPNLRRRRGDRFDTRE